MKIEIEIETGNCTSLSITSSAEQNQGEDDQWKPTTRHLH